MPRRSLTLRRVAIDPLWAVLIVAVLGCCFYTIPHLRDKAREKRELQANCRHDWFSFNAMHDPSFPMRQCRICQKQEQMTRCMECGKVLERRQQ